MAEIVEKEHRKLLRDIRRYEKQFNEANIGLAEFSKKVHTQMLKEKCVHVLSKEPGRKHLNYVLTNRGYNVRM